MATATTLPASLSPTVHDQVASAQRYLQSRLRSAASKPISKTASDIPLIDISRSFSDDLEARISVAREIDQACRTIGFFQIIGHGISAAARTSILHQAERFFRDLSPEQKEALHIRHSSLFRGYEPSDYTNVNPDDWTKADPSASSGEAAGYGTAVESKEAFNWGYESSLDPSGGDGAYVDLDGTKPCPGHGNVWPSEKDFPRFKSALAEYYGQVLSLARHLFRLFALALGLDEDYFDAMTTHPGGIARLLYYPPQPKKDTSTTTDQIGLGAHSDYECFTLLLSSSNPGLQVLAPDPTPQWMEMPVVEDSLTVNIADFLMHWTKGAYKSTVHRVVNPDPEKARYSVPFFFSINYDEVVRELPGVKGADVDTSVSELQWGEMTAGSYILERLRATVKDE